MTNDEAGKKAVVAFTVHPELVAQSNTAARNLDNAREAWHADKNDAAWEVFQAAEAAWAVADAAMWEILEPASK